MSEMGFMENIFSYLKSVDNTSFLEKKFNDVDAAIFSLITYFDLKKYDKKISIKECLNDFLENSNLKEFSRRGFAQKDLIKLAKVLKNHLRYRDVLVSNYVYKINNEEQFGAATFILPSGEKVISFEGTDHEIVGWKEDFIMAYKFPTQGEKDAIKYVSKNISLFDKDVILVGHSKGGHFALVSAMFNNLFIRSKIKKIYNFDGPGLRKKQIDSWKYKSIKNKIVHFVPSYSVIGLLLRHENKYNVVKSSRKDILAHYIFTWEVSKDTFKKDKLSTLSKNLDKSIVIWLDKHSDIEREKIVLSVFDFLEKEGITSTVDLKKIKNILMLYRKRNNINEETRNILANFVKFNYDYHEKNSLEIELI